MMEQGQVLAADILPKVAKEMSKVANSGGALAEKYKTARVAQGRFFNQLEQSQNTIFQGGMDEGLGSFFNDLSHSLKELAPLLKVFGRIFKVAFTLIGSAIRLVSVPFQILGKILGAITDALGEFSSLVIFGLGTAFLAKMSLISKAATAMGLAFGALAAKVMAAVAALLLVEDIWLSVQDAKANTLINQLAGNVDSKGQAIDTKQRGVMGNALEGYRQYSPIALLNKLISGNEGGKENNTNVNVMVAADSQGLIKVVDQRVNQQYSFAEAISN